MRTIMGWGVFGIGMTIFFVAACCNVYLMLILPRRREASGRAPSPVPLVGGLLGGMGCIFAPSDAVKLLFWVPMVLDPGFAYYVTVAARSYRQCLQELSARAHASCECRAVSGCLLGTAVGDALGLPAEGLSRSRQHKMYPEMDRFHFMLGKGMCSDDTEHACMTANALIAASRDPARLVSAFRDSLAWRLRFWLVGLPAGVGLATARGIIRLWLGFPKERSGVFSAGNGSAMRAPIIGALYGADRPLLKELVRASTLLTHTDPRAEHCAYAVALATHMARTGTVFRPEEFLGELKTAFGAEARETIELLAASFASAAEGESTAEFAASIGCAEGVSGYALHTVPVCLHAWRSFPKDYRPAVLAVIHCGGDTDTTAAVVGGIVGAGVGLSGIPEQWIDAVKDWPRSVEYLHRLSVASAESACAPASAGDPRRFNPPLFVPGILPRNFFFLCVVLLHGFRRLLPPY